MGSGILAAISEALLWNMNESYGKLIDNTNLLGMVTFLFHLPAVWVSGLVGLTEPGEWGPPRVLVTLGGIQFFLLYWGSLTVLFHFAPRHSAEPDASPNGGPAERLGNSGVSGGPPSVS